MPEEICEVCGNPWGTLALCSNCTHPNGEAKLSPEEVAEMQAVSDALHAIADQLEKRATHYLKVSKLIEMLNSYKSTLRWWQIVERHKVSQALDEAHELF